MKRNDYNTAIVKNPKTGELETVCLDTGEVVRSLQVNELDKYKFNFDTALPDFHLRG